MKYESLSTNTIEITPVNDQTHTGSSANTLTPKTPKPTGYPHLTLQGKNKSNKCKTKQYTFILYKANSYNYHLNQSAVEYNSKYKNKNHNTKHKTKQLTRLDKSYWQNMFSREIFKYRQRQSSNWCWLFIPWTRTSINEGTSSSAVGTRSWNEGAKIAGSYQPIWCIITDCLWRDMIGLYYAKCINKLWILNVIPCLTGS